jgi:tetratricopeptide (TPR) repeat protein
LPANDVGLLKARVARAWFQIADDEALQSIDTTIELLRQNGPAGIEPLIDALLVRVDLPYVIGRRPGTTWDSLYADAREAHDLAVRHFGAGSAQQLRAAQGLTATLFESGSKRPDKDRAEEAFTVIESALDAARSNPAIAEGNVDLLGAELLYGVLLCRFRNSDDGIRRCWNVAAIASKHHGDESLTVERAFFELAGCLWMHGDLRGGASMAVSAYRMATSRDEPSPWRLAEKALLVAGMVCDLGRGAECAEFTDKALVHAAAMPPGEARSRTMGILRLAQIRVLILQGTTEEAEALAAQFLIEPLCCEQTLHLLRSYALRLGGRFDEAARAADQAISMARAKGGLFEQAWLLAWRGLAELDAGRPAQALAWAEQAMPLIEAQLWIDSVDVPLAYGRALLANGRAAEALEPLRQSYGFWLGHDPKSVWAAEAEYWFGQAYIANGDVKRGRWMVAEAKRALAKSPFKLHQRLAAGASQVAAPAAPSSR